jgi:outer membrane lipoprotein-sorting protein
MKAVNQRRPWLAASVLALLALSPVLAAPDLFTDIYERGVVKQRTMKSLRAKFTETTTSSLLMKPLVAHGIVVAAAPARMAMTYTDPESKTIVMDGRTLTVSWPDRRERQQINITDIQKRIDHYFTRASVDELRSMFTIGAAPDGRLRHADLIDMKPKRKQIQQGLERLELWIDRDSDLLVQMRMTFPGGDQKTIALEDLTLNVPITDDLFKAK